VPAVRPAGSQQRPSRPGRLQYERKEKKIKKAVKLKSM